jgi:hypothetical protein
MRRLPTGVTRLIIPDVAKTAFLAERHRGYYWGVARTAFLAERHRGVHRGFATCNMIGFVFVQDMHRLLLVVRQIADFVSVIPVCELCAFHVRHGRVLLSEVSAFQNGQLKQ